MTTKTIGDSGEEYAAEYLKAKGYEILARNFHYSRCGEIDIIAKKADILAVVEVKTRKNNSFANAYESVNKSKMKKIVSTCEKYIYDNQFADVNIRFDIAEIYTGGRSDKSQWNINYIENAFTLDDIRERY